MNGSSAFWAKELGALLIYGAAGKMLSIGTFIYNGEQAITMDVSGVTIDHNAYLRAVFQ
ncbi:hypothetical protein [Acinetobacter sp. CWB-B33]|uniref:hypothetical protein n=1 Tax=Acinetobacter sp. CWB-B33 TaxID=2815724 RepID=UPI0031FEE241